MKKLFFTIVFLMGLAYGATAQSTGGCPKVTVETSPVAVIDGYPLTFTAKVNGDTSQLKYKWAVSKGEIIDGQGTDEIKVDTVGYAGEEIEATLEIEIEGTCKLTVRAIGVVKDKPYLNEQDVGRQLNAGTPRKTGQYDRMPFAKEKERLANVAFEMKQEGYEDFVAIFIIGRTAKESQQRSLDRVFAITDYLKEKHAIPTSRLRFIFAEGTGTEIYLQPTTFYTRLKNPIKY